MDVDKLYEKIGDFPAGLSKALLTGDKEEVKRFLKQDFDQVPKELIDWVSYPATATGRLNGVPLSLIIDTGGPFK